MSETFCRTTAPKRTPAQRTHPSRCSGQEAGKIGIAEIFGKSYAVIYQSHGGLSKYDAELAPAFLRFYQAQHLQAALLAFCAGVARQVLSPDTLQPQADVFSGFIKELLATQESSKAPVDDSRALPEAYLPSIIQFCGALAREIGLADELDRARTAFSRTTTALTTLRAHAAALRAAKDTSAPQLARERIDRYRVASETQLQIAKQAIKRPDTEESLAFLLEDLSAAWARAGTDAERKQIPHRTRMDGSIEEPGSAGWENWVTATRPGVNLWASAKCHSHRHGLWTTRWTDALLAVNSLCRASRRPGHLGLHDLLSRLCRPPSSFGNEASVSFYTAGSINFAFRCRFCDEFALARVSTRRLQEFCFDTI